MNALITSLITPLGMVGLLSVVYMLYILANLSQRLGAVTKIKPYYRGFYVAMGFLAVSLLARMGLSTMASKLAPDMEATTPWFILAVYHAPFVIAMAISVLVAWRYWSWLFKEKLQ